MPFDGRLLCGVSMTRSGRIYPAFRRPPLRHPCLLRLKARLWVSDSGRKGRLGVVP